MRAAITCLALLVLVGVPTTWATLGDQVTMAQVNVGAGTVNPPTPQTLTSMTGKVRVGWTPPASGLAPDGYDVFRTTSAGSYGPTPLASPVGAPFDDTSAVECTSYYYRTRSRRVALNSGFTTEGGPVMVDDTLPTLSTANAHAYYDPTPLPKVPDFVRVSPGGNVEFYAQVTDNCSPTGSGLNVEFTIGAPINATVTATFGSYTPVTGGPTFNYRYGPTSLASGAVANGGSLSWAIAATDPDGNTATAPGTTATGDGAGPALASTDPAAMVSGQTNFYSPALGYGEVVSGLGSAALKSAGFWTYANLTDVAGISSATANVNALRSSSPAVPLVAGSYSTDNGVAWGWRTSAVTSPNVNAADASVQAFTISATDVLGNVATSASQSVEVDNTAMNSATAGCVNTGNASNKLDVGDVSDFTFGDTVDPASLKATWAAPPFTQSATAVLRDGTRDYIDMNGDFNLTMFGGSTYNTSWNMNASNWVTADVNIPSSNFSLADRQTARLTYGAPASSITARPASTIVTFSTAIQDAAGNPVAANFTASCSASAW